MSYLRQFLTKTSVCILGIGLLTYSKAQLIVSDSMSYSTGQQLNTLNGGQSGTSSWPAAWQATTDLAIASGTLNGPSFYQPSGAGNKVQTTHLASIGAESSLQRQLPDSVRATLNVNGGQIWISFLTSANFLLSLSYTENPYVANVGTSFPQTGVGVSVPVPYSSGAIHLNVMQIINNSGTFTINYYASVTANAIPGTPTKSGSVTLNTAPSDDLYFGLNESVSVGLANTFFVDEIRVGDSFADVVPEPATLAGLGIAVVGYWRKRRQGAVRGKSAS